MKDTTAKARVVGAGRFSGDGRSGVVAKRGKKASVSFPEMLRLMNTYGSVKCLRNHQKNGDDSNINGGGGGAKDDSVRRKFYRWFPDLDERFERDREGVYHPKLGHEFEVSYRERMRKLDGEVLAAKRTGSRREHMLNPRKPRVQPLKGGKKATMFAGCNQASVVTVSSDDGASSPTPILSVLPARGTYDMVFQESAAITSDIEPVDLSFIVEEGIFDDVETSFFSPTVQECPSGRSQACSPTPVNAGLNRPNQISPMSKTDHDTPFIDGILDVSLDEKSWDSDDDSDIPFLNDLLTKSIEECYDDNILVSGDSDISSNVVSNVSWEFFD